MKIRFFTILIFICTQLFIWAGIANQNFELQKNLNEITFTQCDKDGLFSVKKTEKSALLPSFSTRQTITVQKKYDAPFLDSCNYDFKISQKNKLVKYIKTKSTLWSKPSEIAYFSEVNTRAP